MSTIIIENTETSVVDGEPDVTVVVDASFAGQPGGGGAITISGTPVTGDIGRWTSGTALEGRSATETKNDLGLVIGTNIQAWDAVLDATTASFLTADETKLDGIEALADVTDTANVTSAGALMDSEVDANIKTLVLPASTTVSAFGATLVDDAAASNARTTLGVDVAGTDNAPAASTTVAGKIEIATLAEHTTGTATDLAVTPQGLKQELDAGAQIDDTAYQTAWGSSTDAPQQNKVYDKIESMYSIISLPQSYLFDTTDEWISGADQTYAYGNNQADETGGTGANPVPTTWAAVGKIIRGGTYIRDILLAGRVFSGAEITDLDISVMAYKPNSGAAHTWYTGIDAQTEYTETEIYRDTYMTPSVGTAFTGAINDHMLRKLSIESTVTDTSYLMIWMQPTGTLTGANKFTFDVSIEVKWGGQAI